MNCIRHNSNIIDHSPTSHTPWDQNVSSYSPTEEDLRLWASSSRSFFWRGHSYHLANTLSSSSKGSYSWTWIFHWIHLPCFSFMLLIEHDGLQITFNVVWEELDVQNDNIMSAESHFSKEHLQPCCKWLFSDHDGARYMIASNTMPSTIRGEEESSSHLIFSCQNFEKLSQDHQKLQCDLGFLSHNLSSWRSLASNGCTTCLTI